jgi:outer membrane protein
MMHRLPATSSIAAAVMLMLSTATQAAGFDPFSVSLKIASSPAKTMIPMGAEEANPCSFSTLGTPLGLIEAVERALCNNPQTRQAWATAKAQAAALGVSQSAYLPTVSGQFAAAKQKNSTTYSAPYSLTSDENQTIRKGVLQLSLVLTDFGKTSANIDQARAALDAANAAHDATLQAAFVTAAQAYFDTLTALSTLDATREAENAAKESFMAAEAKYKAGVGALTDQLQAQTAYSKAKLDTVKADGELKNAQGILATAMGLPANTPVVVIKRDDKLPDTSFVKPVDELIDEAKQNHPSLLAAQAQLSAAQANVRVTRAEGRPSVALTSEISRQNQLGATVTVGYPLADVFSNNKSIGIQVNIPLFEGFGRHYRVMSAQGQAEVKAAELANAEQQVMLEVWKSYQLLSSETENIKATDDLVQSAQQSYKVARGRYKAGVGNMLELLNVQSALSNAEQQRIQSVSNWHTARLKLAASIGKLGLWAIQ